LTQKKNWQFLAFAEKDRFEILNSITKICVIFGIDKSVLNDLLTQVIKEIVKKYPFQYANLEQKKTFTKITPFIISEHYLSIFVLI